MELYGPPTSIHNRCGGGGGGCNGDGALGWDSVTAAAAVGGGAATTCCCCCTKCINSCSSNSNAMHSIGSSLYSADNNAESIFG